MTHNADFARLAGIFAVHELFVYRAFVRLLLVFISQQVSDRTIQKLQSCILSLQGLQVEVNQAVPVESQPSYRLLRDGLLRQIDRREELLNSSLALVDPLCFTWLRQICETLDQREPPVFGPVILYFLTHLLIDLVSCEQDIPRSPPFLRLKSKIHTLLALLVRTMVAVIQLRWDYYVEQLVSADGEPLLPQVARALQIEDEEKCRLALLTAFVSAPWQLTVETRGRPRFVELEDICRLQLGRALASLIDRIFGLARIHNVEGASFQESVKKFQMELTRIRTRFLMDEKSRQVTQAELCDSDRFLAHSVCEKQRRLQTDDCGPWRSDQAGQTSKAFWRLDTDQDRLARRLFLKRNYKGSNHSIAAYEASGKDAVRDLSFDVTGLGVFAHISRERDSVAILEQDLGEDMQMSSSGPSVSPLSGLKVEWISPSHVLIGSLSATMRPFALQFRAESTRGEPSPKLLAKYRSCTWRAENIREIHERRYLLRNTALELYLYDKSKRSVFLNFLDDDLGERKAVDVRHRVIKCFMNAASRSSIPLDPFNVFTRSATDPRAILKRSQLTTRWVNREIGNFEYLMALNSLAGRTCNDLNQYPVFPWILADYTSPSLNLDDPASYRDLSKVGLLSIQIDADCGIADACHL